MTVRNWKSIVDHFGATITRDAMAALVEHAKPGTLSDEDLAYLVRRITQSGQSLPALDSATADIASTGAPSSLSTILCPLYLRAFGFLVPALGVAGRPAGGLDVLEQLPEYRTRLSVAEVENILLRSGYAHFAAGSIFAPLDAALFAYRREVGAVDVPQLAIVSLLSKKVVSRVMYVGLDVRVAEFGNLGRTVDEAREHARQFVRVAGLLGLQAVCFLTDASVPYQPFIGRGEALVAMEYVLSGTACGWLSEHDDLCFMMARRVHEIAQKRSTSRPTAQNLADVWAQNLEQQGSSMAGFRAYANRIAQHHGRDPGLRSPVDGFAAVDLAATRQALVAAQARGAGTADSAGIVLRVRPGSYVREGGVLATVRCEPPSTTLAAAMTSALRPATKPAGGAMLEEVTHG